MKNATARFLSGAILVSSALLTAVPAFATRGAEPAEVGQIVARCQEDQLVSSEDDLDILGSDCHELRGPTRRFVEAYRVFSSSNAPQNAREDRFVRYWLEEYVARAVVVGEQGAAADSDPAIARVLHGSGHITNEAFSAAKAAVDRHFAALVGPRGSARAK